MSTKSLYIVYASQFLAMDGWFVKYGIENRTNGIIRGLIEPSSCGHDND